MSRSNVTENMRRWPNVALLLAHRLRRWPNSKPALDQRIMFAGVERKELMKVNWTDIYLVSWTLYLGVLLSDYVINLLIMVDVKAHQEFM